MSYCELPHGCKTHMCHTASRVVISLLVFADLLQSEDESVAQSSLELLMTLLSIIKTQDIGRKLLQKAVHSVRYDVHVHSYYDRSMS